jgi:hypothetical protein
MATTPITSSSHSLAANEWRKAILRLNEADDAMRNHRDFIAQGGTIRWVVDTDIVQFHMNPKSNASYAALFPVEPEKAPSPGLVGLSAVLGDFIFSSRFQISDTTEKSSFFKVPLLILEPHTEELDNAIRTKAADARRSAAVAHQAADGGLVREVQELLRRFHNGEDKSLTPNIFARKLVDTLVHKISIILPGSTLSELRKFRDLLRDRKTLIYQAGDKDLHAKISDQKFQTLVDLQTDVWHTRLTDFLLERNSKSTSTANKSGKENKALNELRDARVLAVLELLNQDEHITNERFVFITGTGHLDGLIREQSNYKRTSVYLVRPWAFLGNPRLIESAHQLTPPPQEPVDHPARWKRITQSLNLIGRNVEHSIQAKPELLASFLQEWGQLLENALPYALEQADAPNVRELALSLLSGKPMEALETLLYIAMCDVFVVTAELGLAGYEDPAPSTIKRKPPPLRLAFFPEAERSVREIVERRIFDENGVAKTDRVSELLTKVKLEQKSAAEEPGAVADQGAASSFNYPLLLCFAARFATLDDWHACRILAAHAKAVASVSSYRLPFVTGREAALLESYSRRLDARNTEDLQRARAALVEYEDAIAREEAAWDDESAASSVEAKRALIQFNPRAEFPLHKLRGGVDYLIIDFTEAMFKCFVEKSTYDDTLAHIQSQSLNLLKMASRSERYIESLKQLDLFSATENGAENETLKSIQIFLKTQLELCGLQCAIYLAATGNDQSTSSQIQFWKTPSLWKTVAQHDTVIAKMASLLAYCLWGTEIERKESFAQLQQLGNGELMSYDKTRRTFLMQYAKKLVS